MSKAEKFIQDYTRSCSNEYLTDSKPDGLGGYISRRKFSPWLTPDQARKAVEIAREEIYEWLQRVSFDDYKVADEESYRMGCPYDYIDVRGLINDIKQAMKDE